MINEKDEAVKIIVETELSGHRLDYVVSCVAAISRAYAQRLIKEGRVNLFPPRRVKPSIKVETGDIISAIIPTATESKLIPIFIEFEVVYEDADIIVINKPTGLVVHPSKGHWDKSLVHGLLYKFPDIASINGKHRPGIVHRLDKTTSGLMVVARNGLAEEKLLKDFREKRVNREYIGLCHGEPPSVSGEIFLPIARDPINRYKRTIVEGGKKARTDYKVLWSNGDYSLVKFILHTGRTHQIRVHMSALNCPLVGDSLYKSESSCAVDLKNRVFLHSWKLRFSHPRTQEELSFFSTLPADLTDFLKNISPKNYYLY